MTTVEACPVLSAAEAVSVAKTLAVDFAAGAAERDRNRELPFREVDQLAGSGLLAITVPATYGGADLPPSVVAEVVRILATADPNIAQIPHSHFVYVNLLRLAGSVEQLRHYGGQLLRGARVANAQSERGGTTVADVATTLRPADECFRINGAKYYCTGSLFADLLAVLTRLDDPDRVSGLPEGEYIAYLAADTPGVHISDDWDALGQRTTGSGTITFDGVVVERDQLVARAAAVNAPTGYGAFAHFPSGVVAVSAEVDGEPHGMAVSTFVPVSLDPPLVSFCVQNSSSTWPRLSTAEQLGLSLLGSDQERAARSLSDRNGHRFQDVQLHRGHSDAVFIDGASVWLEGAVEAQVPAGDHQVVLLRIHRVATRAEVEPLVFHGSRFRRLTAYHVGG